MTCSRCGWEAIGGWYRWDESVICPCCIRDAIEGRHWPLEDEDRLPVITTLGELLRRIGAKE